MYKRSFHQTWSLFTLLNSCMSKDILHFKFYLNSAWFRIKNTISLTIDSRIQVLLSLITIYQFTKLVSTPLCLALIQPYDGYHWWHLRFSPCPCFFIGTKYFCIQDSGPLPYHFSFREGSHVLFWHPILMSLEEDHRPVPSGCRTSFPSYSCPLLVRVRTESIILPLILNTHNRSFIGSKLMILSFIFPLPRRPCQTCAR